MALEQTAQVQPFQKTEIALKLGTQELKIPGTSNQVLLKRTATGWTAQEVATIGQHSMFVRRDEAGIARLIVKDVTLRESLNEIVSVKGNWVITVAGYNKLNQYASVFVANPPVIIDGREQLNPYHHVVDGVVKQITARKVAIGYSPSGNLVAVDCTRTFDVDIYFKQDLFSKAKNVQTAAKFGLSIQCPFLEEATVNEDRGVIYVKEGKKLYYFKPIKDNEGLWIDPSSSDIRDLYGEYNNRVKFADVITQSIATRNALKAHPAISAIKVNVILVPPNVELKTKADTIAQVQVYAWKHELDIKQFHELAGKVANGEQITGVDTIHDAGLVTTEEVEDASTVEVEDEQQEKRSASVPVADPKSEQPKVETAPASPTALFDKQGTPTVGEEETLQSLQTTVKSLAQKKGADLTMFCRNVYDTKFDNLTRSQLLDLKAKIEKMVGEDGNL